jgi:hypothetical protein
MAVHHVSRASKARKNVYSFNEASRTKIAVFGARELGLLLPEDKVGLAHSLRRQLSLTRASRPVNLQHRHCE